jgi:polygalacturonase
MCEAGGNLKHHCTWIRPIAILMACCFAMTGAISAKGDPDWAAATQASLEKMADTLTATLKPWPIPDRIFRVDDFGARPDGITVNTTELQKAIDACAKAGGGVVLFSQGDYVTGTIQLKDGVMLQVDKGATILGSINQSDYLREVNEHLPDKDPEKVNACCLIFAWNRERIGIRGEGTINGRGEIKNFPGEKAENGGKAGQIRPDLFRINSCRKIVVDGIHLKASASWMEEYLDCDDLIIQGINVENQGNWNNDGCDISNCQNVIVRNCTINSYDDGICLKGLSKRPMQNVLVENCTAYSECNALKFGTESEGDCQNVLVRNIKIGGTPENMPIFHRRLAESGISWESVDGATVENLLVTHVHMELAESPIFLRLGNRGRGQTDPKPGKLSHLIFDDITGDNNGSIGSIITGIPGAKIHDVLIRNVNLSIAGDGKLKHETIPEKISNYPSSTMFGHYSPAYGFWIRHAEGITFANIKITPVKPDERPEYHKDIDTAGIQFDDSPSH